MGIHHMAFRRKTCSNISEDPTSNKKLRKQADQTNVKAVRPHFPDPIIQRILRLLPTTKSGIRMGCLSKKWECVWSWLFPVLDLEEVEPHGDDNLDKLQHTNFINFLERYLEFCKRDKEQAIDKFRLRMTRYSSSDIYIVDKWLSFVVDRSVKEVDISLLRKHGTHRDYICPLHIFNASSTTSLNLEYVRIMHSDDVCLPSLTTMSLKTVKLHNIRALRTFISECPSIEHMSFTSCSFDYSVCRGMYVSSSSLKSLEVMCCSSKRTHQTVDYICCSSECSRQQSGWPSLTLEAPNLESFTYVSGYPIFGRLVLYECGNLKYINIRAQYLQDFTLCGDQDGVEATIHTPHLLYFKFSGTLNTSLSTEAPNLREATIRLRRLEPTFNWSWKLFSTLRDFLERFDCSEMLLLFFRDAEALIFPESFRRTCSSPLPSVKELKLYRTSPTEARDPELTNSLLWMAPSAEILPIEYSTNL